MSKEAQVERKWNEAADKVVRDPVEYEARRIAPTNLGPCATVYVPYLDCLRTKSDSENACFTYKLDYHQCIKFYSYYQNAKIARDAYHIDKAYASSIGLSNTYSGMHRRYF